MVTSGNLLDVENHVDYRFVIERLSNKAAQLYGEDESFAERFYVFVAESYGYDALGEELMAAQCNQELPRLQRWLLQQNRRKYSDLINIT